MPVAAAIVGSAVVGGIASNRAAKAQSRATDNATRVQEEAAAQMRQDLQPFRDLGQSQINPLMGMLSGQGQADYVMNNPLYQALSQQSTQALMNNQAARGKLGSGATLQALQNNLLGLGDQFASNQYNRLYNLVAMGNNAAAQQGTASMNTASNIAPLIQSQGDISAARTQAIANPLIGAISGYGLGSSGLIPGMTGFQGAALGGLGGFGGR